MRPMRGCRRLGAASALRVKRRTLIERPLDGPGRAGVSQPPVARLGHRRRRRASTKEPRPLVLTGAGDGTNRIFVATQPGTIHVFPNDPRRRRRWRRSSTSAIAFTTACRRRTKRASWAWRFIPSTRRTASSSCTTRAPTTDESDRRSVISRFRVDQGRPQPADPDSEEILLVIPDKYWNHNGGTIVFGPDGYLYIGLGDGGMGGDPDRNGQNLGALVGQDPADRRRPQGRGPGLRHSRRTTRLSARKAPAARSGATAFATCGGSRSTARRATCGPATSGQDIWEEIDIIARAATTAGTSAKAMHPFGPDGSEADDRPDRADLGIPPRQSARASPAATSIAASACPSWRAPTSTPTSSRGQIWALWYDKGAKQRHRQSHDRRQRRRGDHASAKTTPAKRTSRRRTAACSSFVVAGASRQAVERVWRRVGSLHKLTTTAAFRISRTTAAVSAIAASRSVVRGSRLAVTRFDAACRAAS